MSIQSAPAPNEALMVSQTFFNSYAAISGNVDKTLVFPHLETFQSMYIQDALGTSLYNDIISKIISNTLSSIEIELLQLCRQAIVWGGLAKALPWINMQVRNQGILKQSGDNSENIDLKEMQYLRTEAKSTSEFYLVRIKHFLCSNLQQFPEYLEGNEDIVPSNSNTYTSELYLGPSNGSDCSDLKHVFKKYFM